MKLKFEFIDEDTGQRIVIKNKDNKFFFHNSDVHDTTSGLFGYEISMEGEIINTGSGFLTLEEAMEDALADINGE